MKLTRCAAELGDYEKPLTGARAATAVETLAMSLDRSRDQAIRDRNSVRYVRPFSKSEICASCIVMKRCLVVGVRAQLPGGLMLQLSEDQPESMKIKSNINRAGIRITRAYELLIREY